jgi:predicted kinase
MTQKLLILTVGLPRSGKSTWAQTQGHPIVNRDAIRLALHGKPYIPHAEPMVTAIEEHMVRALFKAGHDTVIIDSTNLKKQYRERWANGPWTTVIERFDASKETCIERAKRDGREDLIPIIERMADENYSS